MNEKQFDVNDPILVLQFLVHLVRVADKISMSGGHAYLALPTYLSGRARFISMENGVGSVSTTFWPEAIQFFLRSYLTPNITRDVVDVMHNVREL